jgi:PiT family inorganic phosphate transporter
LLYGPKIIEIVGEKITRLNRIRAFCVALSAAITVIVASTLGLPVSSTHIAVGAVFGVGFLREFITNRRLGIPVVAPTAPTNLGAQSDFQINRWAKARKRKLVRRRHIMTIVGAWLITVPASAVLASLIFFAIGAIL